MAKKKYQPIKCPQCGGVNLKVDIPAVFTIVQEGGVWRAYGYEDDDDKARWMCCDCDHEWSDWFTEPYLDQDALEDDEPS